MGRGPSLPAACVPSLIPASSSSQPTPGGGSLARLQGGPAQPGGSGPVSEVLKRRPRGCLGGQAPSSQLGVGVAEAPRDLVADIPWRPRGPNWQGQLRTATDQLCSQGGAGSPSRPCSFWGLGGQLALCGPLHECLEARSHQGLSGGGSRRWEDGAGPDEAADREGAPAVPV